MWNELNCFSKIISSSFFCDNFLKYFSGGYVIFWSHWNSHKSFIISQIQINLATIVQNVNLETLLDKILKRPFLILFYFADFYLAMFVWVESSSIDIEIRINFYCSNP